MQHSALGAVVGARLTVKVCDDGGESGFQRGFAQGVLECVGELGVHGREEVWWERDVVMKRGGQSG
jgi:hypothetical protein